MLELSIALVVTALSFVPACRVAARVQQILG